MLKKHAIFHLWIFNFISISIPFAVVQEGDYLLHDDQGNHCQIKLDED